MNCIHTSLHFAEHDSEENLQDNHERIKKLPSKENFAKKLRTEMTLAQKLHEFRMCMLTLHSEARLFRELTKWLVLICAND